MDNFFTASFGLLMESPIDIQKHADGYHLYANRFAISSRSPDGVLIINALMHDLKCNVCAPVIWNIPLGGRDFLSELAVNWLGICQQTNSDMFIPLFSTLPGEYLLGTGVDASFVKNMIFKHTLINTTDYALLFKRLVDHKVELTPPELIDFLSRNSVSNVSVFNQVKRLVPKDLWPSVAQSMQIDTSLFNQPAISASPHACKVFKLNHDAVFLHHKNIWHEDDLVNLVEIISSALNEKKISGLECVNYFQLKSNNFISVAVEYSAEGIFEKVQYIFNALISVYDDHSMGDIFRNMDTDRSTIIEKALNHAILQYDLPQNQLQKSTKI